MTEADKRLARRAARLLAQINTSTVEVKLRTPQSTYSMELAKEFQKELRREKIRGSVELKNPRKKEEEDEN